MACCVHGGYSRMRSLFGVAVERLYGWGAGPDGYRRYVAELLGRTRAVSAVQCDAVLLKDRGEEPQRFRPRLR